MNMSISKLKVWLILTVLNLMLPLVYAEQTLVFAIDVIRHGDRTPTVEIPKNTYNWPEGLGELTAAGLQQEFELGKNLYLVYVKQNSLLPENYNSNNLYVRSSDLNRTLMSAQSALFGLYPLGSGPLLSPQEPALPMRYQPIPIHTIVESQDGVLIPGHNQPEFKSLISKYVISSSQWQERSIRYKAKLQYWSNVTGMPIKDLTQVIPLGDNVYIRMLHGVAMPQGINNQDRNELIELANWAASNIFAPYEVGAYASKDLRSTIAKYLQSASTSTSQLKYVLFSAHDSTLMAIMSAFRQPLKAIPPYASDLRILLIKNEANKYYVQLKFNGNDIKLKGCKDSCSLSEFLEYLK